MIETPPTLSKPHPVHGKSLILDLSTSESKFRVLGST